METVLKTVDRVLSNNVFRFENDIFQQIHGKAMGIPMAPTIANLFIKNLERHLIEQRPATVDLIFWKRYIYGIFLN